MLSAESKEPYIAAFKQLRAGGALRGPAWLEQLRQAGIASFEAMGFPTLKNEDWKYTNVEPIAAQSFAQANGEAKSIVGAEVFSRALDRNRRAEANVRQWRLLGGAVQHFKPAAGFAAWARWQNSSIRETLPWPRSSGNLRAQSSNISSLSIPLFSAMARWFRWRRGCRLEQPIYLLFVCYRWRRSR